jgi:hypothetical protein
MLAGLGLTKADLHCTPEEVKAWQGEGGSMPPDVDGPVEQEHNTAFKPIT